MQPLRAVIAALAAGGIAIAAPAFAHPKLIRAIPANSAITRNVTRINLSFDERLIPRMSTFEVMMTGMPGHGAAGRHPPMKMQGVRVSLASDRKTLTAALARPLPAGSYTVNWRVVSSDTHRVEGRISFTVR